MRNFVIFGALMAISVMAQNTSSQQQPPPASPLVCVATLINNAQPVINYSPGDVQILGDLDYGQTSKPVSMAPSAKKQYHAFVFSGFGCEVVDISVKSDSQPSIALADSTLRQIARGTGHLRVRLPYRGPDIEVWYVLVKDPDDKPASFTVQVNKTEDAPQRPAPAIQVSPASY